MREGGKRQGLHLDVDHAGVLDALQELHLVRLRVLAEGAVQATLAFVEVVGAHGLADAGLVGIVGVRELLQLPDEPLVQLGRPAHQLAQNGQLQDGSQQAVDGLLGDHHSACTDKVHFSASILNMRGGTLNVLTHYRPSTPFGNRKKIF